MNHIPPHKHHVDSLMALLLFGLFAACVLSVLLTGARVYRRLTLRDQGAYDRRTCAQYIAAKVRQAPGPDAVSLSLFGDGNALAVTESIEGEDYVTRIYCHDGWLRELFALAGEDFAPEDGEKVLEAQALGLTLEDGLIWVALTGGDESPVRFALSLPGGEGAVP